MERETLINSKNYWVAAIQLDLFSAINKFMEKNKLNRTELASKLNFSKGYISQVLNGDFDHKVSKMVELSLSCDFVPLIFFVDKETFINADSEDKKFELSAVKRVKTMTVLRNGVSVDLPLEKEYPAFAPSKAGESKGIVRSMKFETPQGTSLLQDSYSNYN